MKQFNFNTLEEAKEHLKKCLINTDYIFCSDVKIKNKDEFTTYRNYIRNLYKSLNFTPITTFNLPEQPQPFWEL